MIENVSVSMIITIAVLIFTVVMFIHGKLRSDLIAITALLALMLTGVLSPSEAFTGFSNPVIFIIASMFVVSGAIVRSGLASLISNSILKLAGNNENALFMLTMIITALIGALVSNTGTVAIMMPIVGSMALSLNKSPGRFLMPLAFMSGLGGMLTLIGNPPNMIVNDVYVKAGYESLKLFSFLPIGIVCMIYGVLFLAPVSSFLLSRRKDSVTTGQANELHALADKYNLINNTYSVIVPSGSPITGKSLIALGLTGNYHVTVHDIRRKKERGRSSRLSGATEQIVPGSLTVINAGDELHLLGEYSNVLSLANDYGLKIIYGPDNVDKKDAYRFDAIGLGELVIMSSSRLVSSTVAASRLREQFGVTVLGIQRGDQLIIENIKDQTLQSGDALLVQGKWQDIARLDEESRNWVVVGKPLQFADTSKREKIPLVVIILLMMIVTMATGLLPTVTTAMLAGVMLIAVGCFKNMRDVYTFISWETLIMIACMLPLSVAMEKTGIVAFIGSYMSSIGDTYGYYAAFVAVYFITSLLNTVISFTPLTLLVAPVAMRIALDLGCDPLPFMFGVAAAAGLCFGSSFSTPSNAMVVSPGRYTFMDYFKIGLPLQLILGVIMVIVLPIMFPLKP